MDAMTVCRECGQSILAEARFCWSCGTPQQGAASLPRALGDWSGRRSSDDLLERLRDATAGDYEIRGEIGRGAMAAVFLGYDLHLNRPVAIKVMLSDLGLPSDMPDRFRLEARTAAKLDHPNIVKVYSVKEAGGLLLFVMNFVEGRSLGEIIKTHAPLDLGVARLLVCQIARALDYAHEHGVVHRDVKPANVIIDRRGTAVVADFGIAKAAESPDLTLTGVVIGTPAYISPEQVLGSPATPASDQYSLGVVAYQMLAGVMPFGGSALEMQWAHAKEPAPELPRPDCPPAIRAALMRMLEKDPARRWPAMRDVCRAFAAGLTAADEDAARARLAELVTGNVPASGGRGVTAAGAAPAARAAPAWTVHPTVPLRPRVATPGGRDASGGTLAAVSSAPAAVDDVDAPTWRAGAGEPAEQTTVPRGSRAQLRAQERRSSRGGAARGTRRVVLPVLGAALLGAGAWQAWRSGVARPVAAGTNVATEDDGAVVPRPVAAVLVTEAPESVEVGDTVALVAAAVDARGLPLARQPLEWSSSDTGIAAVTGDGTVEARAPGRVTLTAASGGERASTALTVRAPAVASVVVSNPPARARPGTRFRLTATALDRRGRRVERDLDWRSSNPRVAAVAPDGMVTARSGGVARIAASAGAVEGSARVTVLPAAARRVAARPAPAADPPPEALAVLRTKLNLARYRTESAHYGIASDTLRSIARMLDSLDRRYPGSAQLETRRAEFAVARADNRRRCEEEVRLMRARGAEAPVCR